MISSACKEKFENYEGFVKKFEPKKTTDDCMTPPAVYEAVKAWVCNRYGIDPETIIRPFWPGRDYQQEDYAGKVVVDNPPFSIITKICRWYDAHGVRYFLFGPHLTIFNTIEPCHVITCSSVTYDNGANVRTSFLTNMEEGIEAITAPDLQRAIKEANKRDGKTMPKYEYPPHLLTSSKLATLCDGGIAVTIHKDEALFVRKLDAQARHGKTIFGGGILVSQDKASEIERLTSEAEERRARRRKEQLKKASPGNDDDGIMVWSLSEREREIVGRLGHSKRQ